MGRVTEWCVLCRKMELGYRIIDLWSRGFRCLLMRIVRRRGILLRQLNKLYN